MNLKPDWTYKFSFVPDFTSLNDVYTVKKIYSYTELIDDGESLLSVYEQVGKAQVDLDKDVDEYRQQNIYKLIKTEDQETTIFVPSGLFASIPNYNVQKYPELVIALNVGIYPEEEKLLALQKLLQEQISASLGFVTKPDIIQVGYQWLTTEEYNTIVANREEVAKKQINYFTENIKLREENNNLKTIIKSYEDLILGLAEIKNQYPDMDEK